MLLPAYNCTYNYKPLLLTTYQLIQVRLLFSIDHVMRAHNYTFQTLVDGVKSNPMIVPPKEP